MTGARRPGVTLPGCAGTRTSPEGSRAGMTRVLALALTAALNPTLLTAATVMLLLPNPKRLMLGYLAGALTNGVLLGIAIVEWLSDSGAVSETKHTVAPAVDLALGTIALVAAYVLRS